MNEQKSKNYFAFIDESGNSSQEKFFGLGLLLIDDEIGDFYDKMKPHYEKIFSDSRISKKNRIETLSKQKDINQISSIANSGKRFELKFKNVNLTNNKTYTDLIKTYFLFPKVRFSCLVINRKELNGEPMFDSWDNYIHRAAMLISNNIRNIVPCNVCVLADDLTKPSRINKTFEKSLFDATNSRLIKNGVEKSLFGVSRLESHSSLMLQIVDVLLGAVMYDFKKESGLISEKLGQRQEPVVENIRKILSTESLALNKTFNRPSYFSIWRFKK